MVNIHARYERANKTFKIIPHGAMTVLWGKTKELQNCRIKQLHRQSHRVTAEGGAATPFSQGGASTPQEASEQWAATLLSNMER